VSQPIDKNQIPLTTWPWGNPDCLAHPPVRRSRRSMVRHHPPTRYPLTMGITSEHVSDGCEFPPADVPEVEATFGLRTMPTKAS
jgi:hypothetical protein